MCDEFETARRKGAEMGALQGMHDPRESEKDPWKHRSAGMRCQTCMFYVPKVASGPITNEPAKLGRCRRNAPTMRGFPVVFPLDWCGEHRLDENRIL